MGISRDAKGNEGGHRIGFDEFEPDGGPVPRVGQIRYICNRLFERPEKIANDLFSRFSSLAFDSL